MSRFKMIASGYLILIQDNKILLARRFQTGFEDGKYGLPAGHIEDNETLTAGTCREIAEEIGLGIDADNLDLAHVMHRKGDDIRMDFFFTVKKWTGTVSNLEPEKCDDLQWFELNTLPENIIEYIQSAIRNVQAGNIYSEFGW